MGIRRLIATINIARPIQTAVSTRELRLGRHGRIGARLYSPPREGASTLPLLMFLHGGGWALGDLDTHDAFCRLFASRAGCSIAAINYRLAPENPFPAGLEDAYEALESLALGGGGVGFEADRIAVGGDSAGATLATVVARIARDRKGPPVRGQILICASTDLGGTYPSRSALAEGYLLTEAEIAWCRAQYVPEGVSVSDDRISPLRAVDLSCLPPALVVTAGYDPLKDEGRAYARRLESAGNSVRELHFGSLIHGFNLLDAVSTAAADAIDAVALQARAMLARA